MSLVLGFPPSPESVMASMSRISIFEYVDVIVQAIQESVIANEINENMTNSAYFHALDDSDDYEMVIPTDLQILIKTKIHLHANSLKKL